MNRPNRFAPLNSFTSPARLLLVCLALATIGGCAQLAGSGNSAVKALAAADRSDEDQARDIGRKPAQVAQVLGFGPGMTIMDVIAGGGYYSETLAAIVGPSGTIYAQNPAVMLQMREGANDIAMKKRLVGNRLPNVVRLDRELQALGLAPNSLDGALTALNLHDVYNRDPAMAAAMLKTLFDLLKPGATLGVIDHVGLPDQDNNKLHRMRKEDAIAVAQQVGFEVAVDSDLLANPNDDYTTFVFDPAVRGNTDRFLLKLIKPQ